VRFSNLIAAVDRYSQIALLDLQGSLVCMFHVFRGQVAGWMPDGTCFGPPSLGISAPTPHAQDRIAAALRAANLAEKEARP
jgi:hypothetical protein